MITLLIVLYLIYFVFGLPGSMFGAAWPVMHTDINADFSSAGIISMVAAISMVLGSSLCGRIIKLLDTSRVVLMCLLLIAIAMIGFWLVPSMIWLIVLFIPFGLGAGAADTAINNYMAINYNPAQMNWLHFCWGAGAAVGPIIMAFGISSGSWRLGYFAVAIAFLIASGVVLFIMKHWQKLEAVQIQQLEIMESGTPQSSIKIPGVKLSMAFFLIYSAMYMSIALWGSGYLVESKSIPAETAAAWISLFYFGITAGRLISGFVALKLDNRRMIGFGLLLSTVGAVVMLLPLPGIFSMAGLLIIGLGCAPVYPCMLKETPNSFGEAAAQSIIGYQIAAMGFGGIVMPPVFGAFVSIIGISVMPYFALASILLMLVCEKAIRMNLAVSVDRV